MEEDDGCNEIGGGGRATLSLGCVHDNATPLSDSGDRTRLSVVGRLMRAPDGGSPTG